MNTMKSFKNQLIKSIIDNSNKGNGFSRDYYEEVIANWNIKKWLDDDETSECLAELDKYYPKDSQITEV